MCFGTMLRFSAIDTLSNLCVVAQGRKRRLRKSKYQSFGESNYSTEHLPTNEFHMETPLAMSSMGYTVLA